MYARLLEVWVHKYFFFIYLCVFYKDVWERGFVISVLLSRSTNSDPNIPGQSKALNYWADLFIPRYSGSHSWKHK